MEGEKRRHPAGAFFHFGNDGDAVYFFCHGTGDERGDGNHFSISESGSADSVLCASVQGAAEGKGNSGSFLLGVRNLPSGKGLFIGALVVLTTCFYGVLPAPLLKKYPAEMVCAWAMILGGVVLTLATRPWRIAASIDLGVVIAFLVIVIPGTILPFCFYLAAVAKVGSVYAGLLSSVEPVAATAFAFLFLGTKFQPIDLAGFALVLSTMFILNYKST